MTRNVWILALALAGCDAEPLECGESTTEADGVCQGQPPPGVGTVDDVLDALPDCEPRAPDNRLDLETACADAVCLDSTVGTITREMGEAPVCVPYAAESSLLRCSWSNGARGVFVGLGAATPAAHETAWWLEIGEEFTGTTNQGLGTGMGFRCFDEGLGTASGITFVEQPDRHAIAAMSWSQADFTIYDTWGTDEPVYDGTVSILIFSAL